MNDTKTELQLEDGALILRDERIRHFLPFMLAPLAAKVAKAAAKVVKGTVTRAAASEAPLEEEEPIGEDEYDVQGDTMAVTTPSGDYTPSEAEVKQLARIVGSALNEAQELNDTALGLLNDAIDVASGIEGVQNDVRHFKVKKLKKLAKKFMKIPGMNILLKAGSSLVPGGSMVTSALGLPQDAASERIELDGVSAGS